MFSLYFQTAGILALGYVFWRGCARASRADRRRLLRWGQCLLAASLVLPALARLVPRTTLPARPTQIWSGIVASGAGHAALSTTLLGAVSSRLPILVLAARWRDGLVLLAAGLITGLFLRHLRHLFALRAFLRAQPRLRRAGRVSLLVSAETSVAFSAWVFGRAYVVLPLALAARPDTFRVACLHELQHHRQGDTLRAYWLEWLKAVFFWNPFAYQWARAFLREQELACDEFLVERRHVAPAAYGACLLHAASLALADRNRRGPVVSMATVGHVSLLRHRIESLMSARPPHRSGWIALLGLGSVLLLAGAALATRDWSSGRRLTLVEARGLLGAFPSFSEMGADVNPHVLERLNHYLGTEEGRQLFLKGLDNRPRYRALVERKIEEYGLPPELAAMPLVESAYQNLPQRPPYAGAGLWQFIPQTARHYGLEVGAGRDERLEEERETDAAMRYLRDLHDRFGDWRLAVKAYNEGERKVSALIERLGTRNPWRLEAAESREKYLSSVVAAVLLLHHPELFD